MRKYEKLDQQTKIMLAFNEWIMWSIKPNNEEVKIDIDYYSDYENFRHWCVDVVNSLVGLYDDIPKVTNENQDIVFTMCKKNINLREFRNIDSCEFSLTEINGKICPRN